MLPKAIPVILHEPTRLIADTKGHHILQVEGHFGDCDASEQEDVLPAG